MQLHMKREHPKAGCPDNAYVKETRAVSQYRNEPLSDMYKRTEPFMAAFGGIKGHGKLNIWVKYEKYIENIGNIVNITNWKEEKTGIRMGNSAMESV